MIMIENEWWILILNNEIDNDINDNVLMMIMW